MKTSDHVGITFVNAVLGRGILNSVVNIQLGAFNFSVNEDASKVEPDLVVVSRLRMDEVTARQLHSSLGDLLTTIDQQRLTATAAPTITNGDASHAPEEKLN